MTPMTEKLEIVKGQEFDSYEELKKFIEDYQNSSKQRFRKQRSKYLRQTLLKKEFKKELIYYEIEFACIHGGNYKPKGTGIRQSKTLYTNCPCFFKLGASKDGQKLEVRSLNMVHANHDPAEEPTSRNSKLTRTPSNVWKDKNERIKKGLTFKPNTKDPKEGIDHKQLVLSTICIKQEFPNAASNSADENDVKFNPEIKQENDIQSILVTENTNNNKSSIIVECEPDIHLEERVYAGPESENLQNIEDADLSTDDNETLAVQKKLLLSVGIQTTFKIYSIDMFRENNDAILFYTGLKSYEKFKVVYDSLELNKPPFLHYQGDVTSISKEDQLFLTLMKLKRNTDEYELSLFFGISKTCVFNVLITWIDFMHHMWSMSDIWPSEEFIIYYIPKNFKQYYPVNKLNRDVTRMANLNEANNQDAESKPGNGQIVWEKEYVKKFADLSKRFAILEKSLQICYAPLGQKVYEICLVMCNYTEDPTNI